jgi:hypothetical protein
VENCDGTPCWWKTMERKTTQKRNVLSGGKPGIGTSTAVKTEKDLKKFRELNPN